MITRVPRDTRDQQEWLIMNLCANGLQDIEWMLYLLVADSCFRTVLWCLVQPRTFFDSVAVPTAEPVAGRAVLLSISLSYVIFSQIMLCCVCVLWRWKVTISSASTSKIRRELRMCELMCYLANMVECFMTGNAMKESLKTRELFFFFLVALYFPYA